MTTSNTFWSPGNIGVETNLKCFSISGRGQRFADVMVLSNNNTLLLMAKDSANTLVFKP